MKHFDRDLSKAGSENLKEAVRWGRLSQHEATIHDQQWTQFSIYAKESHEVDILEHVKKTGAAIRRRTLHSGVQRQSVAAMRGEPS